MLIRLSRPDGLILPLAELKIALRVDGTDDDDRLERLIRSETVRYEDFTGRIMLPTELEWRTDNWAEPVIVPAYPVRSVTEIAYLDGDHAEQTLDPGDWYEVATDSGAEVRFTDAFGSPSLSDRPQPVRVRFTAGYDETGASGSGDDPQLDPSEEDQENVTLMVSWRYDRDEPMPDDMLRRMAGNRRIFR